MVWLFKQREFWAKSISRETEKLSTKASSMIQCSVVHIHSIRKTLCTHDILDWVVQIFTMQHKKNKVSANHLKAACMHQEASEGIYLQKGLFFVFDALKAFFSMMRFRMRFTHLVFVPLFRALLLPKLRVQRTLPKLPHVSLWDRQSRF